MKFITAFLVVLLLASCGTAPVVQKSEVLATNFDKTRSLSVVYRSVEMKVVSSQSFGRGGVSTSYTGIHEFGDAIAKQAEAAFAEYKVAVTTATVINGREPLRMESHLKGAGGVTLPVLVIAPVSGQTSATNNATRTSFVFSVQLLDPQNRRVIWKASLDTSTWVGQDFLNRHIEKTVYDDAYATQFLRAVAVKMAQDGII